MALDYTDLFTDLGKLVKHYDLFKADASALNADLQEILDAFQSGNQDAAIEGLAGSYAGFKSQYAGRRSAIAGYAARRLRDRATVLDEIGSVSGDMSEVLPRLFAQMIADSETIERSTVALGTVTAGGSNVGNGTILASKILDGATSPGSLSGVNFAANNRYKGLDSELCAPSETMLLACIADSYQDRLTEGQELFAWSGGVPAGLHGVDDDGSGSIGTIRGLHAGNLLANPDFETFSTNTPGSWTIDAGTAGTHIYAETTNIYHGSKSLRFKGDGSQASIQVSQAPSRSALVANKSYVVSCRIKADATIAAGALTIQFEGTGYTAGSTEKVSIAAASLPTSWTLGSFFVNLPASIPSDFKLVVKWTGTPTLNKNLYIDDMAFGPTIYGGGLGVAVIRGSTPFVRNDQFTFTVANTEGVFQRFMRRAFGVQLPSAGSPTIDDALAG